MSRLNDIINRLELIAKKMEMSIEDAVAVLEGKHPTHVVVQKYKEVEGQAENPTASGATSSSQTNSTSTASPVTPTPPAPSAGTNAASETGNATDSGSAAASGAQINQGAAASTAGSGANNED